MRKVPAKRLITIKQLRSWRWIQPYRKNVSRSAVVEFHAASCINRHQDLSMTLIFSTSFASHLSGLAFNPQKKKKKELVSTLNVGKRETALAVFVILALGALALKIYSQNEHAATSRFPFRSRNTRPRCRVLPTSARFKLLSDVFIRPFSPRFNDARLATRSLIGEAHFTGTLSSD